MPDSFDLTTSAADSRRALALSVVEQLRERGFQALWAGGCVRDLVLGLTPSDYDVATDASPEQVMQLFCHTVPVGVSFGVVRVIGPTPAGEIEVATFRTDGCYIDGRRPTHVHFGSAQEDAARRDFTINGMFLDPISEEVLDYVGGREDLKRGIVRAIGDPVARFTQDKLRLIRAVRFAARFGFTIEERTRVALVAMASQITIVAVERIAQELRRMLVDPRRADAMRLAMDVGLLGAILPPLPGLRSRAAATLAEHGNLWDHTLGVLERLDVEGCEPSFALALAVLVHELGSPDYANQSDPKTSTGTELEVSRDEAGELRARRLATELKLSNATRERVGWLVAHHRALWKLTAARPSTRKRMLASHGIDELFQLHRADALAEGRSIECLETLKRYRVEQPEGPLDPPPLLTGDDLKRLGLAPGRRYKSILAIVRDAQLDNKISTREQALALARELGESDDMSEEP